MYRRKGKRGDEEGRGENKRVGERRGMKSIKEKDRGIESLEEQRRKEVILEDR